MKLYKRESTPLMYLSGGHTAGTKKEEERWIKRTGCRFRCYSYAYVSPGAYFYNRRMHESLDTAIEKGIGIMMDSSAHSFHNMAEGKTKGKIGQDHAAIEKLRNEVTKDYAQYCKKEGKKWDWYVTLDYVKDCPTIYQMMKRLEGLGTKPVPVFHGDRDVSWIQKYIDEGHKLICIGSVHRPNWSSKCHYYDQCFNIAEKQGIMLHGLAVTSLSLMYRFPWYSVDSTTWVITAAYGKLIVIDPVKNILAQVHISDRLSSHAASWNNMPRAVQKVMEQQIESYGFDFDKLRTHERERSTFNALMFCNVIPKLKRDVLQDKVEWEGIEL